MTSPITSRSLYILTIFSGLCLAQHNVPFSKNNFGNGGIWDENAKGPWNLNLTEYVGYVPSFSSLANATTYWELPGPNASYAYVGNVNPKDPWVLSIAVTADIPAINASADFGSIDNSKFFTGSIVEFQPPTITANLSENHSALPPGHLEYTDWDLCLFTWDFSDIYNISYPDKFRQDDGNCTSIVSEQCVRDMENAAIENYNQESRLGFRRCTCPSVSKLSSCDQSSHFAKIGCAARSESLRLTFPSLTRS
jgi:hypothetical protein